MATKLNQIIAVANGKKSQSEKVVTEVYHQIQKPDLFAGLSKHYKLLEENGEQMPSELKLPQAKVQEAITRAVESWTDLLDVVATQDDANTQARADLVVDGTTLLTKVPVTHLLFLEKHLTNVQTFVSKLPVLDPAEQWTFDNTTNYHKTDVVVTNRTLKRPKVLRKAEATKEHPAQVEVYHVDEKVGEYNTVKFSGCLEAKYKQEVLDRLKKLLEAVQLAREEANSLEVTKVNEGDKLFKYIFGK